MKRSKPGPRIRETRILFDEIDIGKTGYTHSFLFAPEGEAVITFRSIRIKS